MTDARHRRRGDSQQAAPQEAAAAAAAAAPHEEIADRLAVFAYDDVVLAVQVEAATLKHLAQLLLERKVLALADVCAAVTRVAKQCGVPEGQTIRPSAQTVAPLMERLSARMVGAADIEAALCYDEPRNEQVWCLCNTHADIFSVAATDYTADELAALRAFLDWAYRDDRRDAGAMAAMTQPQLAESFPALGAGVVARLVRLGWLLRLPAEFPGEQCGTPRYAVGCRLAAEMHKYITDTFGDDARTCLICGMPALLVCPCCCCCCHRFFNHTALQLSFVLIVRTGAQVLQRSVRCQAAQGMRRQALCAQKRRRALLPVLQ